ncbi:hypothetical protein GEMRC1_013992 [Eukaryota sp. GEM-RC1]
MNSDTDESTDEETDVPSESIHAATPPIKLENIEDASDEPKPEPDLWTKIQTAKIELPDWKNFFTLKSMEQVLSMMTIRDNKLVNNQNHIENVQESLTNIISNTNDGSTQNQFAQHLLFHYIPRLELAADSVGLDRIVFPSSHRLSPILHDGVLHGVVTDKTKVARDFELLSKEFTRPDVNKNSLVSLLGNRTRSIKPIQSKLIGSSVRPKVVAFSPAAFANAGNPICISLEPKISLQKSPIPPIKKELLTAGRKALLLALFILEKHSSLVERVQNGDVTEGEVFKSLFPSTPFFGCGFAGFNGDAADTRPIDNTSPESLLIERYHSMKLMAELGLAYCSLEDEDYTGVLQLLNSDQPNCGALSDISATVLKILYKSEALCRLGKVSEARVLLNSVPDHVSSNERISVLLHTASSYFLSGSEEDVSLAQSLVQQARSICPDSSAVLVQLVYSCLRLGRPTEAAHLWATKGLPGFVQK